MNGIAFSLDPREWALGWRDAVDDDGAVVGQWLCLGPVAFCWDEGWD